MKPLSILTDERKLELNNSGTVLLARMIPIQDIKLQKEFQQLFPLNPSRVETITQSILAEGYDNSQPLHIWHVDGKYILIDGHHRREGALRAGLYDVPCYLHEFAFIDNALKYAITLQTERRNLSDAELLKALKVVDSLKVRGLGAEGEKGKSASRSAEILGISTSRVEKTRFVDKYATDDIKAQLERGELTLNKAYQIVRSSTNPDDSATAEKSKKIHKDALLILQRVQSYLDTDDVSGLKVYVREQIPN